MANPADTYTKPQPVVLLGAATSAIAATSAALAIILKDNPTAILVIGIVGALLAGLNVFKDQYLASQVVPYGDVAAFRDQTGGVVAGPAATVATEQLLGEPDVGPVEPQDHILNVNGEAPPVAFEGENAPGF